MSEDMRCIATTPPGVRCNRDSRTLPVPGGRVCMQHRQWGYVPFDLTAEDEIDPRIAERMKAVLEEEKRDA